MMAKSFRTFLLVSLSALIVDQLIKAWARGAAEGVEGRSLWAMWPGVFELKLVYNHGIAFGMLQGMGVFMTPIALAMALFAGWHSWKHSEEGTLVHVTTGALAAGAIGNLIDRLAMGKVTDMFWFRLIDFPVFNVADACITFAGAMLVISSLMEVFTSSRKSPKEADKPDAK